MFLRWWMHAGEWSEMSPWPFCKIDTVLVSEAIKEMIDGHPCSLHEGVDDNGPHEPESTAHQILADHLSLRAPQWHISWVLQLIDHWFVAHVLPHVAAERSTFSCNLLHSIINKCYTSWNIYDHIYMNLPLLCILHSPLCT